MLSIRKHFPFFTISHSRRYHLIDSAAQYSTGFYLPRKSLILSFSSAFAFDILVDFIRVQIIRFAATKKEDLLVHSNLIVSISDRISLISVDTLENKSDFMLSDEYQLERSLK